MSLDVGLWVVQPTKIYGNNITHNLAAMATKVTLTNGLTLYQVLWRPDEHQLVYAGDIAELLDEAWNILLSAPEYYKQFNPSNGWGDYSGLCKFVYQYRNACYENSDAKIGVCR